MPDAAEPAGAGSSAGAALVDTALVVAVPAAEPIVGQHRLRYDRAAVWGVPAHVTILYPFMPDVLITDEVLDRVRAVVASVPRFTVSFARTQWFDDTVLWLEPSPGSPFRLLTAAVLKAFPDYPPYAGKHPGDRPHLTLGDTGTPAELASVQRLVTPQLPIWMDVTQVSLIRGTNQPHGWTTRTTFPLGPASPA